MISLESRPKSLLGVFYSLILSDISKLKSQCEWMKHASSDRQPVARAAHSSAAHDKFFFIFGGFTGQQALDDLWRFDTGRTIPSYFTDKH